MTIPSPSPIPRLDARAAHSARLALIALGSAAPAADAGAIAASAEVNKPGDRVAVAFRFTAWSGASWQVDDLYVDPWRAR